MRRFEALDGWRGIAALAITFYHVPIAQPLRDMAGWKNMELFVDFFFVLSGFVIMHAWGQRLTTPREGAQFMVKRFWRVWPLHIAVLALFVVIELARWGAGYLIALPGEESPFSESRSLAALASNVFLLQSLNLHGTTTWNGPAWSISVEFWTYALFALAMLLTRGRAWALALLAGIGCGLVAWFSPIALFATHDFGLPRAVFGFFVGALTYRLHAGSTDAAPCDSLLEVGLVLAMAAWLTVTGENASSLFTPIVFSALVLVFASGGGIVTRLLESRPIQALGLWSYSIYLVHALLFYGLRLGLVLIEKVFKIDLTASGSGSERVFSFGSSLLDFGAILALLGLTILVSRFTYRWIEARFMVPGARAARAEHDRLALALR